MAEDDERAGLSPGSIYQHFRGNYYVVVEVATDSETGLTMVMYRDINNHKKVWVRSLNDFGSKVADEHGQSVYRFTYLGRVP